MCDIKHVDFYARDWLEGTSELTLEERGLHWVACSMIYSRGGPVTRDHLRQVSGVDGRVFKRVLKRLLDLGKLVEQDGLISQQRCSNELAKAELRLSKWRKNLDNPAKPNGYDRRAAPTATSQESKSLESSQSSQSPSPARAREAPPPQAPRPKPPPDAARPVLSEAGLAGLRDFKIPEEWVVEATSRRHAASLPELNVRKEADKLQDRWRDAKRLPNDPWLAWITWALIGRPDKTNAIEPQQRSPEEVEAERQAARLEARARMGITEPLEAQA